MAETKVILTQTVANLGHSGDVVDVKSGYARNYLFPQGLAFAWTKGAEAQITAMKRARLAKAVATREEAIAAKDAIEGTTVEIAAKVSESGKQLTLNQRVQGSNPCGGTDKSESKDSGFFVFLLSGSTDKVSSRGKVYNRHVCFRAQ